MRKNRHSGVSVRFLVGAVSFALFFGGSPAYAIGWEVDETVANVDLDLSDVLRVVHDDRGAVVYDGSLESAEETGFIARDESGTEISISDSGVVTLSAEGNAGFEVSFEDISSSLVQVDKDEPLAYEAGEGAVLVPQIIDTHFRGVFILESVLSPAEFSMSVSNGEAMELVPVDDGGVIFYDAAGEEIGGFAAPWAKDANDNPVPTWFVVEGQRVRQVIDTDSLAPDAFPVVADPPVYVNYTKRYVIDVKNHGSKAKWKYLNQCTAAKKKSCDIGRTYTVSASVQTSLNVSSSFVGAQIGVTAGASFSVNVNCSVDGPGKVTLYASANKITYKVRTVRTYGVAPKLKKETKTSGSLTAYKPNGRYVCS